MKKKIIFILILSLILFGMIFLLNSFRIRKMTPNEQYFHPETELIIPK